MTTQTLTLTEFLLARIAEDEVVAKAATVAPWRDVPMGSEGSIVTAGGNTIHTARKPATCREFADATHIARHDPARVLAECEAKRRIVQEIDAADDLDVNPPAELAHAALLTPRLLATAYADHPDYRQEWKP